MRIPFISIQRIILTGVLAILPIAVQAQTVDTSQATIDAALARCANDGIPVSLLESKISEGKAKGIPMDRIATAVDTRLRGLEQAQAAMKRAGNIDIDAAQLSVGADAIGAGVSGAVLEKVTAAAPKERRAVAVAALTQLVLDGTTPDAALVRVQDALAKGPQDLANLAAQSGVAKPNGDPGAASRGPKPSAGSTAGPSGPPPAVPPPGQTTRPLPPGGTPPPRPPR